MPARNPPRKNLDSLIVSTIHQRGGITLGITRRPKPLRVDEIVRVGGQVQAVVRQRR